MTDEDVKKVEILKAELQKLIDYFNECEEESERMKQEVPLGVPSDGKCYVDWKGEVNIDRFEKAEEVAYNSFSSYESAKKHAEMLFEWRQTLVANAKGEPIDIKVLLPLLKKGWVGMDKDGVWVWYETKPYKELENWCPKGGSVIMELYSFNLKPTDNWETSLMECGL